MLYLSIGFRKSLVVVNIPSQSLEKRINKVTTELRFVVLAALVSLTMELISFHEFLYCIQSGIFWHPITVMS